MTEHPAAMGQTVDAAAAAPARDRADVLAERLAVPVLLAALASVPAVFLTLFEGTAAVVGAAFNALSGAVLVAEAVVLFAVADDRRGWIRRNRWLAALAVVMVPAVIFAVGPVQLLRVVRIAGALRIIRVGRIVKAGRILRHRAGLDETWQRLLGWMVSALVAAFVAMVLADPTSQSRQLLSGAWDSVGAAGVILAGAVLGAATWIVFATRQSRRDPRSGDG